MMMSSLTFDPVSVPRKREREQRLRICKMTTVKGKRKKYKNKQSETGRKEQMDKFRLDLLAIEMNSKYTFYTPG